MTEQETENHDIVVTYDTLFEILRNEKTKDDLQKLNKTFFKDVVTYLNDKQASLNNESNQENLFEADETENKLHQITNIKKILRDIYERREKKILDIALNKSRFTSNIIDTSSLLDEEKLLYDMIISLLDSQRDKILKSILNGKIPSDLRLNEQTQSENELPSDASNDNLQDKTEKTLESNDTSKTVFSNSDEISKEVSEMPTKLIRFLLPVPQFMGEDMREYGPYDEEDVTKLPLNIAELLIEKNRAEEIKEE